MKNDEVLSGINRKKLFSNYSHRNRVLFYHCAKFDDEVNIGFRIFQGDIQ